MNPHLNDALARLNERRGASLGSRRPRVTERDLAPKTRKAIDGLTEVFELELKDDGQVYLAKPGNAISADAATVSPSDAGSPAGQAARLADELDGVILRGSRSHLRADDVVRLCRIQSYLRGGL